ncbi:MAG: APC family permease [Drouetiella hepatica Uher 2000/2452]|jgi:APA family basic amino acid/polyamine antiporter|uniref:APC family permease n=1 Tax=Drouetiella hepatica Uher 2000/2452 TaxID=904376 RepID=A0A951UN36_9CYAN|nr:APC family permease [Drouetiella hepatica Uher 2000/2452]
MPPKLTPDLVSLPLAHSAAKFGVRDLTLLGLGSILGTGVFVGIGIAAHVAGAGAIAAVIMAALMALGNELNAAQLSVQRSATSGTYEYSQKYLSPWLRFTAGWAFLLAKVASAATAALGFAGYLLNVLGQPDSLWLMPIALLLIALLTLILLQGLHHASFSRRLMVFVTLLSLLIFLGAGLGSAGEIVLPIYWDASGDWDVNGDWDINRDWDTSGEGAIASILQATALMFVAYFGFGRMAYLSHAVRQPRRTIPRSVLVLLSGVLLLYWGVAIVVLKALSAETLDGAVETYVAPLAIAARQLEMSGIAQIVAIGALTALLTTLLNLMLDCAQMLQSMAEQHDIPQSFARFNAAGTTPTLAVLAVSGAIVGFIGVGDVQTTWSFSAFALLIYCAITQLAVLKLSAQERLYPRLFPQLVFWGCLFLAFWVDWQVWLVSLGLLVVGLIWRGINQWSDQQSQD